MLRGRRCFPGAKACDLKVLFPSFGPFPGGAARPAGSLAPTPWEGWGAPNPYRCWPYSSEPSVLIRKEVTMCPHTEGHGYTST